MADAADSRIRSRRRHDGPLSGTSVLVAGAGLAGLTAARALEHAGAAVRVVEARDRVGGRVWTIRDGFARGQHAEAGADLIEGSQRALLELVDELQLKTTRILKRGFGFYGAAEDGAVREQRHQEFFETLGRMLAPHIHAFHLAEQRAGSPIIQALGRTPVSAWLDRVGADPALRQRLRGLRGLFLADPEDLSLLALVDFFATNAGGSDEMRRLIDGNDALATAMARGLNEPPELGVVLRRVRHHAAGVVATLDGPGGQSDCAAGYLVSSLPATTLAEVEFDPPLPDPQAQAIRRLKYGAATRVLLQFSRRFWRRAGHPLAFGSDRDTGAVWDANEQQRGPAGILSLLAGGAASQGVRQILSTHGPAGLVNELRWLGEPSPLLSARVLAWEDEHWSRGGYAYFDPGFDPAWRDWLSRPCGRIFFAGEHTSIQWQGYMNGAVESGQRVSEEIKAQSAISQ